jgi:hypothetical protein
LLSREDHIKELVNEIVECRLFIGKQAEALHDAVEALEYYEQKEYDSRSYEDGILQYRAEETLEKIRKKVGDE